MVKAQVSYSDQWEKMMSQKFTVISYNLKGTRQKEHIIDELLSNVCLLEHLLSSANNNLLKRSANHITFVSGAWSTFGRPSGGLAYILRLSSFLSTMPALFHSDDNHFAVPI